MCAFQSERARVRQRDRKWEKRNTGGDLVAWEDYMCTHTKDPFCLHTSTSLIIKNASKWFFRYITRASHMFLVRLLAVQRRTE